MAEHQYKKRMNEQRLTIVMVDNTIGNFGFERVHGDLNHFAARTKTWALNTDRLNMTWEHAQKVRDGIDNPFINQ